MYVAHGMIPVVISRPLHSSLAYIKAINIGIRYFDIKEYPRYDILSNEILQYILKLLKYCPALYASWYNYTVLHMYVVDAVKVKSCAHTY